MGHIIDITAWRAASGTDTKQPATIASPAASTDALDGVLNAVSAVLKTNTLDADARWPFRAIYAIVRTRDAKVVSRPNSPAQELREQQDIQQPDARILSPSSVSPDKVYPRYGLTMIVAILAGLGIGVVAIGLLERLDDSLRSGQQIEHLTGRPLVGMIPRLARRKLRQFTPARFAIERANSRPPAFASADPGRVASAHPDA